MPSDSISLPFARREGLQVLGGSQPPWEEPCQGPMVWAAKDGPPICVHPESCVGWQQAEMLSGGRQRQQHGVCWQGRVEPKPCPATAWLSGPVSLSHVPTPWRAKAAAQPLFGSAEPEPSMVAVLPARTCAYLLC